MRSAISRLASAAALFVVGIGSAAAVPMYGITAANTLVSFDSATPGVFTTLPITGLQPMETLLGIDQRPANGALYALGSSSRLYRIDPATGVAFAIGPVFSTLLSGTAFGFDFNPTVDRIRITSDANQNLRVHPDTGAVAAVDTALQFAATDANAAADPSVVGSAYTNNVFGATTTTLYDVDSALNILATQVPPNAGTLNTVGPLGVDIGNAVGFDITTQTGTGLLVADVGGVSNLYTVNLTTGATTLIGATAPGLTGATAAGAVPGAIGIGSIPTLSQWGLIALAGVLGLFAFFGLRRREAL